MKRLCLALAVVALLLLVVGVGTATASPPMVQDGGQLATSDQGAGAAAGTAQQQPTNSNAPVSVLSEGDGGDVTQTNEATSDASAGNLNATSQNADQTQAGPGLQAIGQSAENEQDAFALALTHQEGASNENVPVRVLSPGDGGDVTQTNDASSDATAGNANLTDQNAEQAQSTGSCTHKCASDGKQLIGQSAESDQKAGALAATVQEEPSNQNISVRVLSEGDDGDVTQTNEASSDATAGNLNTTEQTADQQQSGGGDQIVGQSADSDQKAGALAATVQEKPSNSNISVRVLSPGDNGDVTQTNQASSNATAGNVNKTEQTATQEQSGVPCKCADGGTQIVGQSADSDQKAGALAVTVQEKPSNKNVSVRVLSPGDDGDVTQTNQASSNATAGNLNVTKQTADQTQAVGDLCKCGGDGKQVIGQSADSDQEAKALALTVQEKPSNTNTPIRVLSKGDGGDVTQTNEASSEATAGNLNVTKQDAEQAQAAGDLCKCGGAGQQVIGQSADSDQHAGAISVTIQEKPTNTNAPIRVLSKGDDGDVTQTNEASSDATAGNLNVTDQTAAQAQGGAGLQIIGQAAKNEQDAFALGLTLQKGASNVNEPVRVLSPGGGGSVTQENIATSNATAANVNWTDQTATQLQGGGTSKGCCGFGIQAIGQLSKNEQSAKAFAVTAQLGLKPPCVCGHKGSVGNSNEPTRVLSPGHDGDVEQSNVATSSATAVNWNIVKQTAEEVQVPRCLCLDPGIQAIGQLAKSDQSAVAGALTFQLSPKNVSSPDRKKSPGHSGDHKQLGERSGHDFDRSWSLKDQDKHKVNKW
jgi:hypothetical protein